MNEATDKRACQAQAKHGNPCRATPLPGRGWCFTHDPDGAAARDQARAKGGAAASRLRSIEGKRPRLDTLPALARFTAKLVGDTVEGTLTPDVARVAFAGLTLQGRLLEASDLEERLARLEAAQPNGSRRWQA